ncbi:FCD domain-containing protein [Tepidanaerobacter syntrophicus]|uniref:FCD domain-containing protein n=1 Tax=Tepidanaerobacter syntrophicus TaxID=224999 RepID=UPI001BD6C172|nr:FCD domain-containing protein [Tepidanaerobacter syntrophicus]
MLHEKQRLLFFILKIIDNSKETPVGSGYIRNMLKLQGFDVSEATIGRMLKEMDFEGYTEKIGFKGRNLTPKGKEKLEELEHENTINRYGKELMKAIKGTGKQELIDMLIARKAIESQLAKLAAMYATYDEIEKMKKVIERQRVHVEEGVSIAEDDVEFHKLIAKAARNKVLDAAMDLIRQHGQLSPMLEYIRKEVKGSVLLEHENIFKSIAARKPAQAEKAMIRHIERLENDVRKYWENFYEENSQTGNSDIV